MWGSADETEQLPARKCPGLGATVGGVSLNGKLKSLAARREKHGW